MRFAGNTAVYVCGYISAKTAAIVNVYKHETVFLVIITPLTVIVSAVIIRLWNSQKHGFLGDL